MAGFGMEQQTADPAAQAEELARRNQFFSALGGSQPPNFDPSQLPAEATAGQVMGENPGEADKSGFLAQILEAIGLGGPQPQR